MHRHVLPRRGMAYGAGGRVGPGLAGERGGGDERLTTKARLGDAQDEEALLEPSDITGKVVKGRVRSGQKTIEDDSQLEG